LPVAKKEEVGKKEDKVAEKPKQSNDLFDLLGDTSA